jgi:dephospho-CoA kinase
MRAEGNTRSPLRVIVSGGIGSGKSTVVGMMRVLGAVVIEADEVGHQVLEPEGPAFRSVAERWPVVVSGGRIDRARLASIVFTDSEQLALLESLTHPHIGAEIRRRVAEVPDQDVVVELPIATDLMGEGWIRVVVDVPNQLKLARSIGRGMSADDLANRMASQPDRSQWRAGATFVIENSGSVAQLEQEVVALWSDLEGLASR